MDAIPGKQLSDMVQLGFMASFHGEPDKSEQIFLGLQGMNPDCDDIALGLAVAKINAGHTKSAIEILENKVLANKTIHNIGSVFLAWAHKSVGNTRKYDEISDLVMNSQDQEAISLLKSLQESVPA